MYRSDTNELYRPHVEPTGWSLKHDGASEVRFQERRKSFVPVERAPEPPRPQQLGEYAGQQVTEPALASLTPVDTTA